MAKTRKNTKQTTFKLMEAQSDLFTVLLCWDTSHGFGVLFMFQVSHQPFPKCLVIKKFKSYNAISSIIIYFIFMHERRFTNEVQ